MRPRRDYGEAEAEAAADGFDSPAEAAIARRQAAQAAAEIEAEYSEHLPPSPGPEGDSRAR